MQYSSVALLFSISNCCVHACLLHHVFFLYVCYFLSLFHKLTFHHLCCDTFLSIYCHFGSISLSLVCLSVSLCNVTSFFLLFYEGEIVFFVFDHQNGEINTKHILSVYSITSNKYSWDLKSEHCVFQSAFGCCEFERCSKSFKNITIPRNFLEIH